MSDEPKYTIGKIDKATFDALEELKTKFGVKTNAEVIRKALAMVEIALKKEQENEE